MPRPDDERNEAQHKKARHRSDRAWNVVRFEELEPPRGLRSDAQSRLLQTIPRVNNLKASQDSTKLISANMLAIDDFCEFLYIDHFSANPLEQMKLKLPKGNF